MASSTTSSNTGSYAAERILVAQRHQPRVNAWRAVLLAWLLGDVPAAMAMRVPYCPEGRTLETGLCYPRCPLGWRGLGCTCWQGARSFTRGCGTLPTSCDAFSFRRIPLPPVQRRDPFSLVISADPQLFRNFSDMDDPRAAMPNNGHLVKSINAASSLGSWPEAVGGGALVPPRALVLAGDMTEDYHEREQDAFRHYYDPSFPSNDGELVQLPTWLSMGNHDYVNNVGRCPGKSFDPNFCAKQAVSTMRGVIAPTCDTGTWMGFPKANVSSFDVGSLAYSFDYNAYHFIMLQHNPRYDVPSIGISNSMAWLAAELSHATAQQRKIIIVVHAHKELNLTSDPSFGRMMQASNVVAVFYGHIHIKPWGYVANYPNTTVPLFNCGASWYNVYCLAEFAEDGFRVATVTHFGDSKPRWFGVSSHRLQPQQKAKPVLDMFIPNPNIEAFTNAAAMQRLASSAITLWGVLLVLLAVIGVL